jgi:FixJ family two-component response regulator
MLWEELRMFVRTCLVLRQLHPTVRHMALAQGLSGKKAADMLGISEPTVRTHLKHIFSKTGTFRQAKLLQLLQSKSYIFLAIRLPVGIQR